MDPVDIYTEFVDAVSAQGGETIVLWKLFLTLVLLVLFWALNKAAMRFIGRQKLTPQARFRWSKAANYAIAILGVLAIGAVWWEFVGSVVTLLGLVLAGVAVALRDPLTNLAGWAYIVWRKPFGLGDRVEVDRVRGDVANIDPFTFTLAEVWQGEGAEQPTGRLVHMPNNFVFIKHVANATLGFEYVWDETPVVVTFESNWEKAKSLISEIIERHTSQFVPEAMKQVDAAMLHFMLPTGTFEPTVFTSVVDIGVELTMRYVVEVRKRRVMREAIWEDILHTFAQEPDIDFAYPTQRVYFNRVEGKPGAGGPSSNAESRAS